MTNKVVYNWFSTTFTITKQIGLKFDEKQAGTSAANAAEAAENAQMKRIGYMNSASMEISEAKSDIDLGDKYESLATSEAIQAEKDEAESIMDEEQSEEMILSSKKHKKQAHEKKTSVNFASC